MTEQNTLTTNNEVERILSEFRKLFVTIPNDTRVTGSALSVENYIRQILTPLIEDRNARAREVLQEVYENVHSEIVLNKIEAIALSHGIDLSTKK